MIAISMLNNKSKRNSKLNLMRFNHSCFVNEQNYFKMYFQLFFSFTLFSYLFSIYIYQIFLSLMSYKTYFQNYTYDLMIKKTNSINHQSVNYFDQVDSKCVCQICTCHAHKCPHAKVHIPFQQISSYQRQYVSHPLNSTQKMCTDNSKYLYRPYDYLNSCYREDYPGHKPQMRQKIIPRVKNQNKDIQFGGQSWYKSTYQPKSVQKDKLRNKDKQFNQDFQPFMGSTTYKESFYLKRPQSQMMNSPSQINYPRGYKFNGDTTYANDFIQKSVSSVPNFKPVEKVAPKGKHYLNSTYRDDFNKKPNISLCPILSLPKYPQKKSQPSSHIYLNKTSGQWQQK